MRAGTFVGVVVAAVLVAALWWVSRQGREEPVRRPAASDPALEAGDEVVDQALLQIPGADSTFIKTRWMDVVPGPDIADFSDAQREVFLRHANARPCTCGCGYTLAACRSYDPTCPVSGPIVEALADSVRAGHIRSAEGLRTRPEAVNEAVHGG